MTTSGIGSPGVFVTGVGSSISATGLAIATNGAFDPKHQISVKRPRTRWTERRAMFSGGSISTAGNTAYAVVADGKGVDQPQRDGADCCTTGNGSGGLEHQRLGFWKSTLRALRSATKGATDPR